MASKPIVLQPGLLQVRTQYTPNPDTGDQPENVLWFVSGTTASPTIAQLNQMQAAFDPAWGNVWKAIGATNHNYTGSIWTDWSTPFGLTATSVGTFTATPGSFGAPLVSHTAVLISLHVQERWRGGHFRIYLPWVGVGAQSGADNNKVLTSQINAVTAAFQVLNTATLGSGVLGGQSQRCYRQKQTVGSAHLLQIASFTVQPTFASQRRRTRKAPHH